MALDKDGDVVEVQGSAAKPYVLKNVGGTLSCSCVAWKTQSLPIDRRTCKHLKSVRGAASEEARIAGDTAPTADKPVTASDDNAAIILARAEAQGRKLRQDEKAKLHGPPVLLAHPFEGSDVDPKGWWMSEKLDGVRAYWNGRDFISRQGNVFHAPDWYKRSLPAHPLDGELWMGRHMFQQTISVVKSRDAGLRWNEVSYLVFDMPHLADPFEARMEKLQAVAGCGLGLGLQMVDQTPCLGHAHLEQELKRLVALGAEGLMLREPGSLYEARRSHTILKVKPWKDADAIVIGLEAGKGRHKGRTGGLIVKTPEGIEFHLGTGLSDKDRENPPKIGTRVTYRYMDLTADGVPKGASFLRVRPEE